MMMMSPIGFEPLYEALALADSSDSSTNVSEAQGCSFWRQPWKCFSFPPPKQAQLLSVVLTAISHV